MKNMKLGLNAMEAAIQALALGQANPFIGGGVGRVVGSVMRDAQNKPPKNSQYYKQFAGKRECFRRRNGGFHAIARRGVVAP